MRFQNLSISWQIRSYGTRDTIQPGSPLRILLDYRPALRQRTGVGEYVHELALSLIHISEPTRPY